MSNELASKYSPGEVEPEIAARWNEVNAFHAEPGETVVGSKPFAIVIPPPNVTGALHLGHAINNTLQDILIRWHRMLGDNTTWIPGTDHAGIATQTVVEKRVLAETGRKRTYFSREEFVEKIQAWKDEYEARILGQLKAMGCSCDWDRTRFTMDPICARAVREAFFRLFQAGLIYRGKRLVNWDPATETALADDEVEMQEIDGHFYYLRYPLVEEGAEGSRGQGAKGAEATHTASLGPSTPRPLDPYVIVATTRPETMLGDTAVAINPRDPRAAALRGRHVRLPIVGRVIPIIEDEYVVLPNPESQDAKAKYATGFLKVTPAHDPNDWEIGRRHNLPVINVFAPDAAISVDHGWPEADRKDAGSFLNQLLGMDRFEARKAIVAWFRENHLLEEVKPYKHTVGHSYRSHVPIEPYLSDQWYVATKRSPLAPGSAGGASTAINEPIPGTDVPADSLAGMALRAMAQPSKRNANHRKSTWEGQLTFHPDRYARTFEQWHEGIRDWCISRQIWWGHRIPVWSWEGKAVWPATPGEASQKRLIENLEAWKAAGRIAEYDRASGEPRADATRFFCVRNADDQEVVDALHEAGAEQDADVLDTWFSSALWPISTFGWPDENAALKTWNPSSVLSTARDIITLWVSRMVMFNLFLRGCLPFRDVFIHATILDGQGQRMSKSLGNGVDPLDIIASHGSDAMRFTLASMSTTTQDVRLPVVKDPTTGRNTSEKFDFGRNFANKTWNAVRFALSNLEEAKKNAGPGGGAGALNIADKWLLSRLATTVRDANAALGAFDFAGYSQTLYDFVWRDLCDWYIEAIKPVVRTPEGAAQRRVLALCIDASLRLMHPVMPYITEKLWEKLNDVAPIREISGVALTPSALLVHAAWPVVAEALIDPAAEAEFALVQQWIGAIREARTTYKVPPRQKVLSSAKAPAGLAQRILPHRPLIETLANIEGHEIGPRVEKPADAAVALVGEAEVYLHGLVDADAERTRLVKRLDELTRSVAALEGRLSNKAYTDKAPAHLVQQTRDQLAAAQKEADAVRQQVAALKPA